MVADTVTANLSIGLLSRALLDRGYTATPADGRPSAMLFTHPSGWQWRTPLWYIDYPFVSAEAQSLSKDKLATSALAVQHQVNVPATLLWDDREPAAMRRFLDRYAPLVVKPRAGAGSHGLTLGITEYNGLQTAVARVGCAGQPADDTILLQQQVSGRELRFTVLDGVVVSVFERQPAQVIGDGLSTVGELVAHENSLRARLETPYLTYPLLDSRLVRADLLSSTDVPLAGAVVNLSRSSLLRGGASIYDVAPMTHASYLRIAERLAAAINPDFLVVDMIIVDLSCPASADNYVLLECNTAPSLALYYAERNGRSFDITAALADMIDLVRKRGDL